MFMQISSRSSRTFQVLDESSDANKLAGFIQTEKPQV